MRISTLRSPWCTARRLMTTNQTYTLTSARSAPVPLTHRRWCLMIRCMTPLLDSLWTAGDLPPLRHTPARGARGQVGRVTPGLVREMPDTDDALALTLVGWGARLNHDQSAGRAARRGHQILHGLQRLIDKDRTLRQVFADQC